MRPVTTCFLRLSLVLALSVTPASEARDFTLGIKAWNASGSANGLDMEDEIHFPGAYFSWGVTDHFWISAGYVEGENDFSFEGDISSASRSFEEADADLIFGWSFAKLDAGIGYRSAGFTVRLSNTAASSIDSEGLPEELLHPVRIPVQGLLRSRDGGLVLPRPGGQCCLYVG